MGLGSTFTGGPGAGGAQSNFVAGIGNAPPSSGGGIFQLGGGPARSVNTAVGAGAGAGASLAGQLAKANQLNPQYEADKAATDVQNKATAALEANRRRERALGISAGSGRARNRERNTAIAIAAAKAAAANKGRRGAQEVNRKFMLDAAKLGLDERGMDLREQMFAEQQYQNDQPSARSFQSRRGETRALREARDYERGQLQEDRVQSRIDNLLAMRQASAPKGTVLPVNKSLMKNARAAALSSMAAESPKRRRM